MVNEILKISSLPERFSIWDLIACHLPDMLQVAQSIRAGRISPSAILRKLDTASRKNKLYFAFRELGRVVRTSFLLEYIGDEELRRIIQVAQNKCEGFNQFAQWVYFGADTIAENVRDDQLKVIKYNHLIANLVYYAGIERVGDGRDEAYTRTNCRLQPLQDVPSQSIRTVRAERALSTTGGLRNHVLNEECRKDKGYRALLPIYEGILTPSQVEGDQMLSICSNNIYCKRR